MIKSVFYKLYEIFPARWKGSLTASPLLAPLKNFLLREGKEYRKTTVDVGWPVKAPRINFRFNASYKMVRRATTTGIENTLLRSSLQLLDKYNLDHNAFILDVGANYGFLSLVWSMTASRNNGKVFSFEPHPGIAACIRESASVNQLEGRILVQECALSNTVGSVEMHLYGQTSNAIKKAQLAHGTVTVPKSTIDTFADKNSLTQCDLIKIDVDGPELEVLEGATGTINKFKPLLVVETNNDPRLSAWLIRQGYVLYDMNLKKLSAGESAANIFCVHESRG